MNVPSSQCHQSCTT
jgi:hypothetical protein